MSLRILIADDNRASQLGLLTSLESDSEVQVVGRARNGAEAHRLARSQRPDVVVMNLSIPLVDGVTATAAIRRDVPTTEVVAVATTVEDEFLVDEAVRAGAISYVTMNTPCDDLCQAVKAAAAGQVRIPEHADEWLAYVTLDITRSLDVLSPAEKRVLKLLAQGQSDQAIAALLHTNEAAIRSRVNSALIKLQLKSRLQAVLYARQMSLAPVA